MTFKISKMTTALSMAIFWGIVLFSGVVFAETSETVKAIENIATEEAISSSEEAISSSATTTAGAMDLVDTLSSQLGITKDQAAGGAGALFNMAKDKLSGDDYAQLANAIPGIGELIEAAPAVSTATAETTDKVTGVTQGLGSLTKTIEGAKKYADVYDQFKQLGLDTDMVSQFVPKILSFSESAGGETVMNILKSVWQ
jgi:hypothetical protein